MMKNKKIIKSSVASLLLSTTIFSANASCFASFSKRKLFNSSSVVSDNEKNNREKKPKKNVPLKMPRTGYADKKPVPQHILKQIEVNLAEDIESEDIESEDIESEDIESDEEHFSLLDLKNIEENKYYKALVEFLRRLKIKYGKINKCKKIQRAYINRIFSNEIFMEFIAKASNYEKDYQCGYILNWLLSEITILNEEKFEVLLRAHNQANGRVCIEARSASNLVKFLYNEDVAEAFYNKLCDPKTHYKVYSNKKILETFEEFAQTNNYLNNIFLF